MVDIPIIFSAPMVRAALDGWKTETRRFAWGKSRQWDGKRKVPRGLWNIAHTTYSPPTVWQKAKAGDLCWVREKHWVVERLGQGGTPHLIYDEEWDGGLPDETKPLRPCGLDFGPRPSIHMYRWASRLTFELTAVRMERLQDISVEDMAAEGLATPPRNRADHLFSAALKAQQSMEDNFRALWNSLHGPDAWAENPEVVVLSGVFHQQNIDTFKDADHTPRARVGRKVT